MNGILRSECRWKGRRDRRLQCGDYLERLLCSMSPYKPGVTLRFEGLGMLSARASNS